MDKLVNWLLQTTSDGATYLQVIIMSMLWIVILSMIFNEIQKSAKKGRNKK